MTPRHRWTRDDWIVLGVLLVLLAVLLLQVWDDPPTSWRERDFR